MIPSPPLLFDTFPLSERAYRRIRELVRDRFGIFLGERKDALITNRLRDHLAAGRFRSYEEYLDSVEADRSGRALNALASMISTNYTYFFREPAHFQFLVEQALPEFEEELSRRGDRDLRIWSAAASSGEEPYSIVMSMLDYFGSHYQRFDAGVLATDLSPKVLRHADAGLYTAQQAEKVPPQKRDRYFDGLDSERVRVIPRLRREVLFRKFNLIGEWYPFKKPFHVIFCRNVLIYFDPPTRTRVTQKLFDWLVPGGYLFIGHSETIDREAVPFRPIRPAIFQKPRKGNPV
jgi:chemotaxis protein methyltransferase CheR